ncbi:MULTISPECIES: phage portal protein [unclassified Streptomyces]|uniref:phage portal protein n=1 Tax=unclassified Streptomyces TaxID=2593676 RepID=UPI00365239DD
MPTLEEAQQLVTRLESELIRRRPEIDRNEEYYRGKSRLRFASEEFAHFHGDRYKDFSDNWVQIVADSPVERLEVNGFKMSGADLADRDLWKVWQVNGLDSDSQLGFLGAVTAGRSFVLVWGDPADPEMPVVTFEDAAQCIVAYEPGSRRLRRAALKRWQDGGRDYATLYLPNEVWKFERSLTRQDKSPQMADVDEEMNRWNPRSSGNEPNPQPNPLKVVPMVELPNRPMLTSEPIPDVTGVVSMQDAINLLWAMLLNAADAASFPQRVITGAERPMLPKLNAAGEVIGKTPVDLEKFAVDRVLWITGKDAKISSWPAANLTAYTEVMEVAVGHLAAQTRTPQHYLIGKMANVAEGTLLSAETGLVKRVNEKKLWFGQSLREVARLIFLAQGKTAQAAQMRAGSVLWADSESRSHAQMADALLKLRDIGFPFEWLALRYGLTPTEVADVVAMREAQAALDPVADLTRMMAQRPADGPEDMPQGEEEAAAEEVPT